MTDFRLRSLLEVVRAGSISLAAENLHITQPAVSQHIASLEEGYGVQLMTRAGRRSLPTEAGMRLYRYAERVEALYRSIDREMDSFKEMPKTYEIGATLTVAEYVLPELLGAHRQTNQAVKIRLSVQNTEATVELVRRNRIALGVVEGPFETEGLRRSLLRVDELVVVCAPAYPLADRASGRQISTGEVLASDLILREPGSGTREVFERYLVSRGYKTEALRPLMEIGSNNAIKSLLESELGVSVISRLAVARELHEGRLVELPLDGPRVTRDMQFVWSDYSDLAFVEEFQGFCRSRMKQ